MSRRRLSDLFAIKPIADALFPHLTLADVYKLHAVCKALQSVVLRLQDKYLNINAALKDFVKSGDSFRRELGEARALVVGRFVINLLAYRQYENTFLDILVEQGPSAKKLIQYLCEEESYQEALSYNIGEPATLSRPNFATKIRLTITDNIPIDTLFKSSYTTADLCFMSWNKIFSMFPLPTFVHHQYWLVRELDDGSGAPLAELAELGWTTRDLVWYDWTRKLLSGLGPRHVGDKKTLVLSLMPVLDCPLSAPDYVLELSEFLVHKPPSRIKRRTLALKGESGHKLISRNLRHQYLAGRYWYIFARRKLGRWTEVENYKIRYYRRLGLPIPERDYVDDLMPIWHQEMLDKEAEIRTRKSQVLSSPADEAFG